MRKFILPVIAAAAIGLGGCASNYSGEGALAGGALGAGEGGGLCSVRLGLCIHYEWGQGAGAA